jgi:hypothetical protein
MEEEEEERRRLGQKQEAEKFSVVCIVSPSQATGLLFLIIVKLGTDMKKVQDSLPFGQFYRFRCQHVFHSHASFRVSRFTTEPNTFTARL